MCRRESAGFPNSGSPKVGVLTEWDGGISSLRCSRMGKTQNNQQQLWGAGGDGKYPHFPRNWKVRPKNNSSLLKKKKVWQDALQKRKYQSVQALFTFSMSYICFVFLRFLSASQSPIFSFWTEDMIWKLSGTLVVNDLLEGTGRFTVITWLANADGSRRYFWEAKKD